MDYVAELVDDAGLAPVDPLPTAVHNSHYNIHRRLLDHLRTTGDDGSAAMLRSAKYDLSGTWLNAVFSTGRYVGDLAMTNQELLDPPFTESCCT